MEKLTAAQLIAGVYRLCVYAAVAIVAATGLQRHRLVAATAVLGFSATMFSLLGHRDLAALTSVPLVGLVGWLLFDRVRSDPWRLKSLLAVREAEWSHQRHEFASDIGMAKLEIRALRARLDRHAIPADDIPSLLGSPSDQPDTI